jgi:hypothetical protein
VTAYDLALLLHLVAVIGFFAGMALAAAAQVAAWGRSRPGEIAAVLSLARTGDSRLDGLAAGLARRGAAPARRM